MTNEDKDLLIALAGFIASCAAAIAIILGVPMFFIWFTAYCFGFIQ